jgi:hypothetical protein
MAISRMNMERQMRNMGGLMTLEEPRQGFFLGKIVRKAKKAIKKVVKSPIGKAAIIGGLGMYAGGLGPFANLKGAGFLRGAGSNLLTGLTSGEGFLGTIGNAFRVGGDPTKGISGLRVLGGLAGAGALAAPFLMGGDEEEIDEGVPVTGLQPMVENIRQQARDYYQDPTKSALYFMPPKSAVRFGGAFAGGGLADIPRGGYESGESVLSKEQMAMINDMKKKGMDMSTIESMTGATTDQITNYLSSLNKKEEGGIMDLGGMEKDYREGGFVPLGAEERADDVPARLSKNEFVFTADAVRNAGGGDIDKGAEVMQNMMDNLEAGGTISEESQGEENPAQAMFDQAQMLEGRLA